MPDTRPDIRPVNPVVKQVLELGPTLVFFLLYIWIKDDSYTIGGTEYSGFIVATVVFVPLMVAAMLILRRCRAACRASRSSPCSWSSSSAR